MHQMLAACRHLQFWEKLTNLPKSICTTGLRVGSAQISAQAPSLQSMCGICKSYRMQAKAHMSWLFWARQARCDLSCSRPYASIILDDMTAGLQLQACSAAHGPTSVITRQLPCFDLHAVTFMMAVTAVTATDVGLRAAELPAPAAGACGLHQNRLIPHEHSRLLYASVLWPTSSNGFWWCPWRCGNAGCKGVLHAAGAYTFIKMVVKKAQVTGECQALPHASVL